MLDKHKIIGALLSWAEDVLRDGTDIPNDQLFQEINELVSAIEDGTYDAD